MNYKKLADEINESLNFNLTKENMDNLIAVIQKEYESNVKIRVHGENEDINAFKEAAIPLIKYLCENHHPHVSVIVTPTTAELLEGIKSLGYIDEFIRD